MHFPAKQNLDGITGNRFDTSNPAATAPSETILKYQISPVFFT
jgi:hypothetical protein